MASLFILVLHSPLYFTHNPLLHLSRETLQSARSPPPLIQGRLEGAGNSRKRRLALGLTSPTLPWFVVPNQHQQRAVPWPGPQRKGRSLLPPSSPIPPRIATSRSRTCRCRRTLTVWTSVGSRRLSRSRLPWQAALAAPTPSAPPHSYVTVGRCRTDISVND